MYLSIDEHFKYSNGWLDKFTKNIQNINGFGDSGEVDKAKVDLDRIELKKSTDQYDPDGVWNCDETACYYQLGPNSTLAHKSDKVQGMKLSKKKA